MAMRCEGASFGGLSHKFISPRARIILLSFIYFYLLLIAGAFGNVVVSTAVSLKAAPVAWLFLTIGGLTAGQMIYRWKKDILMTTAVCVIIALIGIWLGSRFPTDAVIGAGLRPTAGCSGPWPPLFSVILQRCCPSGGSRCPSITSRRISSSWDSFSA